MGLLTGLLLLPVTGPVRGLQFIVEQIKAEADAALLDERRIQAELMRLSLSHDLGEISTDEYQELETLLLEQLNAVRAYRDELELHGAPFDPDSDVAHDDDEH
jgi:hypothetical protein